MQCIVAVVAAPMMLQLQRCEMTTNNAVLSGCPKAKASSIGPYRDETRATVALAPPWNRWCDLMLRYILQFCHQEPSSSPPVHRTNPCSLLGDRPHSSVVAEAWKPIHCNRYRNTSIAHSHSAYSNSLWCVVAEGGRRLENLLWIEALNSAPTNHTYTLHASI